MNPMLINQILQIAVTAITTARNVRDAVRAANPGETLPSDAELIQKLITDAGIGKVEAQEFQAWVKTLPR